MLDLIKKGIENITIEELYNLYQTSNIATIKVADNQIAFVQE